MPSASQPGSTRTSKKMCRVDTPVHAVVHPLFAEMHVFQDRWMVWFIENGYQLSSKVLPSIFFNILGILLDLT